MWSFLQLRVWNVEFGILFNYELGVRNLELIPNSKLKIRNSNNS